MSRIFQKKFLDFVKKPIISQSREDRHKKRLKFQTDPSAGLKTSAEQAGRDVYVVVAKESIFPGSGTNVAGRCIPPSSIYTRLFQKESI